MNISDIYLMCDSLLTVLERKSVVIPSGMAWFRPRHAVEESIAESLLVIDSSTALSGATASRRTKQLRSE